MFFRNTPLVFSLTLFALLSFNVQSTVVEIRTSLGIIEVNLFDNTTPETVSNFLTYVNSGAYADIVVHRSVSNFIVQGGGFQYTGPVSLTDNNQFTLDAVQTGLTLVNEPELSNVRGTIAMAKLGGQPNSATSQWFINLSNNVSSLDANVQGSGGYSVFGQVLGDGMQVVDAIASLSVLGGESNFVFKEIPLRNYTAEDLTNRVDLTDDNLVVISDIVVTDRAVITNIDINPVINTRINESPVAEDDSFTVNEGATVTGNVITHNDGDGRIDNDGGDGGILKITQVNGSDLIFISSTGEARVDIKDGFLLIKEDGSFSYTHNGSEPLGVAPNFSYTLSDGKELDTGKVTIVVAGINNPTSGGSDSESGGGSIFWLALIAICSIQIRRRFE